jgi:hypothetical protein
MWKEVVKGDITQHVYDAECATLTPPELPENFTDKKLGGVIENPHAQTEIQKGLFFDIYTCQDKYFIYIIHSYPGEGGATYQVFRHLKVSKYQEAGLL